MKKHKLPIIQILKASLGSGLLCALLSGCKPAESTNTQPGGGSSTTATTTTSTKPAVFTLAWSEYPSWSVFGVAHEQGLLDEAEGKLGDMEKKWNVDIVLKQTDYDTCIQFYGSSQADAVCITNMDILGPANSRAAVAILPTSTSAGADACLAVGVNDIDQLAGKNTHGLERSVSQYAFERILVLKGKNPKDYPFVQMDPSLAAQAMQTGDASIQSIMVWNPFVLQTLRTQQSSKVLFDSTAIPEEIIDMVVVGKDSLAKQGGKNFALAILDTYYEINRRLADPKTGNDTLVAIGAKFSNLGLDDMKLVVEQTKFYSDPQAALTLLESDKFRKETMPAVATFCVEHGITEKQPAIGYDQADAPLNFDLSYLKSIRDGVSSPK
jgi:ABC-type nitrate/sulfonate/bicarbonate transport system substrate-binding protein